MSIFIYSLLGGVQLFAMIKMLGLLKQDMSSNQNMWAWHGYQVSMRVLELTLCTLLAVIATTPLLCSTTFTKSAPSPLKRVLYSIEELMVFWSQQKKKSPTVPIQYRLKEKRHFQNFAKMQKGASQLDFQGTMPQIYCSVRWMGIAFLCLRVDSFF